MKIIADTATLFAPSEGEAIGVTIIPLDVIINGKTYKDYVWGKDLKGQLDF